MSNFNTLKIGAAWLLLLALSLPCWASEPPEKEAIPRSRLQCAILLLNEFKDMVRQKSERPLFRLRRGDEPLKTPVSRAFESLVSKAQFQEFLKRNKIDSNAFISEAIKEKLISAYHQEFFSKFEDPKQLSQLQDESLRRSLQSHGAPTKAMSGRERLLEISKENKTKFIEKLGLDNQSSHIAELADRFELDFTHNTNRFSIKNGDALISSKQLEEYGTGGGLNSREFNRDFMQSDDNVFFHVKLKLKNGSAAEGSPSEYGDQTVRISTEYAKKQGFISFFVMYADELLKFGERHYPNYTKKLRSTFENHQFPSSKEDFEHLKEIRNKLYLHDFTVSDFEEIIKASIIKYLRTLEQHSPAEFEQVTKSINDSSIDIPSLVKKALFPLGLDLSNYEFKIPTGVPTSYFSVHRQRG